MTGTRMWSRAVGIVALVCVVGCTPTAEDGGEGGSGGTPMTDGAMMPDMAPDMTPEVDMAPPEVDMAPPEVDMAPPEVDMAPPEPDMAPPEPDMAPPEPDMAPPPECEEDADCEPGELCEDEICVPGPICEDDELEENDRSIDATALDGLAVEPRGEARADGLRLCGGDADVFTIAGCENGRLEVSVIADAPIDFAITDLLGAVLGASTPADDGAIAEADLDPDAPAFVVIPGPAGVALDYSIAMVRICPECITDEACGVGRLCDGSSCVPGECRADADCPDGVCADTACVECAADDDCADGVCANNTCVECAADADCPDGVCAEATCVACRGDRECADGVCVDQQCAQCRGDGDCPAGVCVGGVCLGCGGDGDCPAGVCVDDVCVECQGAGDCPDGVCEANTCVECAGDGDCPDGVCQDARCVACAADDDCPDGVCEANTCVECAEDGDCPDGVCRGAVCVECAGDGDCPDGVCEANTCVECIADDDCADGVCVDNACAACRIDADCPGEDICVEGGCGEAPCVDDDFEENDAVDAAAVIEPGFYDGLQICPGDADVFRFEVCPGGEGLIEVRLQDADGDLDLQGLTLANALIDSSTDGGDLEQLTFEAGDTPTGFAARIFGADGVSNTYSVEYTMRCPDCVGDDDCGPGGLCVDNACLADPCADPSPVVPGEPARGTTAGAPNTIGGSCGGDQSPEAVHLFVAPAAGAWCLSTVGSGYDTLLHVREAACDGEEIACNDDSDVFEGLTSSITIDADADAAYAVIIDGFEDNNGDYVLSVSPGVCGEVPVRSPGPGELIVTEFMQNPSAVTDANGEWFELYNATDEPLQLEGLAFSEIDGGNAWRLDVSLIAEPGSYTVLGKNADPVTNGGVELAYAYGNQMALGNTADDIRILNPAGEVVDVIAWDGGPVWPDPDGASSQLGAGDPAAVDNDDGSLWCEASVEYGAGDLGTPGAPNSPCP